MVLEAEHYRLKIRFERLFADPRIFDEPRTFVRGYLESNGLSPDKTEKIYETMKDPSPLDDAGRPSVPSGIGKFRYQGKMLRSEYMQRANLRIEYVDFGSGLQIDDHKRLWKTGRWDDLAFEFRDFQHQHLRTGIADIPELHTMLKSRATPTTMATVELPRTTGDVFAASVRYLEDQLKRLVEKDGGTVEVYAASELDPAENKKLEKRLARESTDSTVYIILSTLPVTVEQNR